MFEYTIFIMLLPLLSFIVLGLAGMKMQHKVAGLIGTCSLISALSSISLWTVWRESIRRLFRITSHGCP